MDIEIGLVDPQNGAIGMEIQARLDKFNADVGGMPGARTVTVAALEDGTLVGGLVGYAEWGWLFISDLFVDEAQRGRGVGRLLMAVAEAEARRLGCHSAFTDTLDFQAPGFYEKLGYVEFGRLPGWGPHNRYWMTKSLA